VRLYRGRVVLLATPVLVDCEHHARVRPASVVVTCADANFYLTGLRWKRWDGSRAVATGIAHVNDCTPYCAAGKFHTYPAELRLSAPLACTGRRVFFSRYWWRRAGPKPRYGAMKLTCSFPGP
jgi:hypothetical protein